MRSDVASPAGKASVCPRWHRFHLDAKPVQRSVIRKASIELASDDVRAPPRPRRAVSLRGDLGEYIEGSSITGEGKEGARTDHAARRRCRAWTDASTIFGSSPR